MRLGVFLLFFAIILATVSPPVAAQLSPPGPPDVEKPVKKGKPPKKAKEPPPGDEEGDPDGEEGEPDGEEGDPDGEEGEPDGEGGEPDGEEGEPDGAEGDRDGEEGDLGGRESGSPESGDHSGAGGEDPAGPDRSSHDSSSADEDGPSYLASQTGCSEDCVPSAALTDRLEGDATLSAADAELAGALEDDGLYFDTAADASLPVLALFALMGLGLLVGLAGGLRALHGRISGDG